MTETSTSGDAAQMARMILHRTAVGFGMLAVVSVIVFFATQALPGDIARQLLGQTATPEQLARIREQLGLDRPIIVQYLDWLGGLFVGDFGVSLSSGTPVTEALATRAGNTAIVVLLAAAITLPLGVVLGTMAARRAGSVADRSISSIMHAVLALPEFVVAIALVWVVSGVLRLLPPTSPLDPRHTAWEQPDLLVLPVTTMVIIATPHLTEAVKTLVRDELGSDHVRWARLSGISERRVLGTHALRNVAGPSAQVGGVTINYLLGGMVAVDAVFSFPGIGRALVDAVAARDIVVVQAIAMGVAAMLTVTFLIADVIGMLTDPKLRSRRR
ncbi:ABC transporter permease [Microbacterium tumbae]